MNETGYYWVRVTHQYTDWEPAEWDGEVWMLIGSREAWGHSDMYEIGEKIIKQENDQ